MHSNICSILYSGWRRSDTSSTSRMKKRRELPSWSNRSRVVRKLLKYLHGSGPSWFSLRTSSTRSMNRTRCSLSSNIRWCNSSFCTSAVSTRSVSKQVLNGHDERSMERDGSILNTICINMYLHCQKFMH